MTKHSELPDEYAESIVEQSEILNCKDCGAEVYQCCECKEYFSPEDCIYCGKERTMHICESCYMDKEASNDK